MNFPWGLNISLKVELMRDKLSSHCSNNGGWGWHSRNILISHFNSDCDEFLLVTLQGFATLQIQSEKAEVYSDLQTEDICSRDWEAEENVLTRLAVDRVKPWLTYIVCPWYHNDPIINLKDLGLLLMTDKGVLVSDLYFILCGGGYGCYGAYIWTWNMMPPLDTHYCHF